jgi:hypothetical protein
MRKGEEGCSIETAMYSVYILNQERNHVTKSHVKIQFTVYRVNFRCQADTPPEVSMLDGNLINKKKNQVNVIHVQHS